MSLEDKIGQTFMADIRFDHKKVDTKESTHNELYIRIFEKQNTLNPNEKSVFQLFENLRM